MITVEKLQKFIESSLADGSLKKESMVYTNGFQGDAPIVELKNENNELILVEIF